MTITMALSLMAMSLAQAADVLTTRAALRRGAREANPIVAWAMERLGIGWIPVKLALAAAATALLAWQGLWLAIIALAAAVAAVAWRNHRQAR